MRVLAAGLVASLAAWAGNISSGPEPTFHREIVPILQKNCQGCHRPGEVAPMSFLTYEGTRPWAKAIKAAVLLKKMPPWSADPQYGHFSNAPKLTEADIRTIAAWVDRGAPEGDSSDNPPPIEFTDGWAIAPDVVVALPKPLPVPASGVVELTTVTVPSPFKKDTWVGSIEIRPSNRAVVHHVVLTIVPHRKDVKYGVPDSIPKARDENGVAIGRIGGKERLLNASDFTTMQAVYLPGAAPLDFRLWHAAKLIPVGYDLQIQMHYTPNGTATTDQTRIGFTVVRPPERRFITLSPTALRDEEHFHIPAGDPNWETRTGVVFRRDTEIVWFLPHMHLRGRDMTYRLVYPNGESEIVLKVPHYDFEWQIAYQAEKPIQATKGTRLEVTAHYDNSAANRSNPDPTKDVWWGDQTWEEMMVPWFGVVVDKNVEPKKVVGYAPEYVAGQRSSR